MCAYVMCVESCCNEQLLDVCFWTCVIKHREISMSHILMVFLFDASESYTLEGIRNSLIRQEDSIIFSLVERAQFCYNADTYSPNAFPIKGDSGSLVEFMVKQTEKQEKKTIKIFTVDYENIYNINDMWTPVTLDHPAKFETLAMDSQQKEVILRDLERFLRRREYYRKVGKAWKRGYLLYGPQGMGKSSLIAAMANYLNFDVYDLELTELRRNSDLRKLLLATANKSILVVEDIDCTVDFSSSLYFRQKHSLFWNIYIKFQVEEMHLPTK